MISAVSWVPKGASKAMPNTAEPPSTKEIQEFIKNGTFKKSVSDMDDKEEEMEGEIENSDQVAHAKAVSRRYRTNPLQEDN